MTYIMRVYYRSPEQWKDEAVESAVGFPASGSGTNLETMIRDMDFDCVSMLDAQAAECRAREVSFITDSKVIHVE